MQETKKKIIPIDELLSWLDIYDNWKMKRNQKKNPFDNELGETENISADNGVKIAIITGELSYDYISFRYFMIFSRRSFSCPIHRW